MMSTQPFTSPSGVSMRTKRRQADALLRFSAQCNPFNSQTTESPPGRFLGLWDHIVGPPRVQSTLGWVSFTTSSRHFWRSWKASAIPSMAIAPRRLFGGTMLFFSPILARSCSRRGAYRSWKLQCRSVSMPAAMGGSDPYTLGRPLHCIVPAEGGCAHAFSIDKGDAEFASPPGSKRR